MALISQLMFTTKVNPRKYINPLAIWHWTTKETKSAISVVNDRYKYEVFDIVTGDRLYMGYSTSLSRSKNRVFDLTNNI